MTSSRPDYPTDTRYSRRLMWLAVFIVLLFGGYAAAWFFIADRVEQGIDAGIARMHARDGVTARCDRRNIGGFPFRFELFCDAVAFDDPRANVALQAGALRGARQIYDLKHTLAELDGPLTIAAPVDIQLNWTLLRASVREAKPLPERVSVVADKLTAVATPAASPKPLFASDHFEAHMRTNGPDVDLASNFAGLKIDPAAVEGRTLPVMTGQLDATVLGGVALAAVKPFSLRGQSAEVRNLELAADGGKISVSGPLSFDAAGLANGRLTVAVESPADVSRVLQTAIPEQASAIKAGFQAIQFMGARPSLPLDIKDGQARLGFIKLGRFAPVD